MDRTRDIVGFERVLNVFDISSQTYYYWKNKLKCPGSFLNLCKIRHPLQVISKEISTIKQYLINEQYLNWSSSSCLLQNDDR